MKLNGLLAATLRPARARLTSTNRPGYPEGGRWSPASPPVPPAAAGLSPGEITFTAVLSLIARRQPLVGVPDPIAIAKMCSAVIPFPMPALTVGSVTDATVLPACSGTDAK
jgi:hypothetical protein